MSCNLLVMLYTIANGACQSGTERKRLRQESGDRQMSRGRERGSLGRLFRENTKIFLNGILRHVRDDSGFSRPNVGRYATTIKIKRCFYLFINKA